MCAHSDHDPLAKVDLVLAIDVKDKDLRQLGQLLNPAHLSASCQRHCLHVEMVRHVHRNHIQLMWLHLLALVRQLVHACPIEQVKVMIQGDSSLLLPLECLLLRGKLLARRNTCNTRQYSAFSARYLSI